jgi:hypothetical protein
VHFPRPIRRDRGPTRDSDEHDADGDSTSPMNSPVLAKQRRTEVSRATQRPTVVERLQLFLATLAAISLAVAIAGCNSSSDEPTASDAGGPITVDQLLARSADMPVAVRGLLHSDQGVARLCAAILESYPPQCGEPSVELVGLNLAAVDATTTAAGVTWKEGAVMNLEPAADGRFIVIDVEAGLRVQIVLGLYSGVPDPDWTLTTEQATELSIALAGLTGVDASAPSGGLGYHGFTIVTADGAVVAYAGKVASTNSDPSYVLDDPDRTIERLLLATAKAHLTAEEITVITDAISQK